ncbi:hypothetical protein GYB29_15920 [bacterium]|jgi:hypothetical protein|nr:hypothetical protein [bacterium]
MEEKYLKVPVEMAEFALRERKVSEINTYLGLLFYHSSKCELINKPFNELSNFLGLSISSIYSAVNWLEKRDWMYKSDSKRLYSRSLKMVHQLERWKYSRCALLYKKDFETMKAFMIGAFLSSAVKTGNMGKEKGRQSRRPLTTRYPVSLSFIEDTLNVSHKTAYNYRKLAEKHNYIKMESNLVQIEGITLNDVKGMKQNNISKVRLNVFGSDRTLLLSPNQLRTNKGKVFAQQPNFIYPLIHLKNRKVYKPSH